MGFRTWGRGVWLLPVVLVTACATATEDGQDSALPTDISATDDTGAPTDDTGAPTDDTGAPTDDTGAPTDAGAPTDDTLPGMDTGIPTDTGTPTDTGGPTCSAGQSLCGTPGTCVTLATDTGNCGACGHACAAGQSCVASVCGTVCPAGQTLCGGACATVGAACTSGVGACSRMGTVTCAATGSGTACGATAGAPGVETCNGIDDDCNGVVDDIAPAPCGAGACAMGGHLSCVAAIPPGTTVAPVCVGGTNLPATTVCRASAGPCDAPEYCTGTGATCPPDGALPAGTACASPHGGVCAGTACACAAGQTNCAGACANLQTDSAHCGACGTACPSGGACSAGACHPANDDRAHATPVTLTAGEATVTGTTTGATFDGPAGCMTGPNVWYSVTLTAREVLYADTAGSGFDTKIHLVDSTGAEVATTCNDDAGCTTGGFTSFLQSHFAVVVDAGTYSIGVGGFATASGDFTLHVQHLPRTIGSFFYDTQLAGMGTNATVLVGASAQTSLCGGTASGEDVRWFITCGAQMEFFSVCPSDGGTYSRRSGTTFYDPVMYVRSAQSGAEVICDDDGGSMGGTNCVGTAPAPAMAGDTFQYGSRLNNVTVPRGINAVFVDERTGGSGMTYTLAYTVR